MKPETVEERVEHTPGPWEAVGALVSQYEIRDGKKLWGLYVANCSILDEPEASANARLIAAAPDLVKALESCQRVLADLVGGDKSLSTINIYAQAVKAELKARAALSSSRSDQE